ncbi:protein PATRONUS 2-like isoform X1 [Lycium ferocissimum]|uniref:protein PATRONUS 2-like isoform X1 n=1 Tax=Lycium ferocissimum TaxID=112874 RepID=UPI002815D069|nr:protein PATRONUS 2-like isoform X1 [Lycium ferocissimum]XP_059282635.1 protein PATRONUS 2-like isoform X1 [Lycium ferocissimum]
MAKNLIQRPLIFQDENSDIYLKKGLITGKSKSGKPEAVIKKGTAGLKRRNALNDITNKSNAIPEEATRKKSSQKELKVPSEFNIAEETFQHDHKKCIEAQRSAMTRKHFLESVLPGCDSASPIDIPKTETGMSDKGIDSPHCYPMLEELPMSEFSWLKSSWKSPPKKRDSPPSSPFELEFEPVEFTLKEVKDC